MGLSIVPKYCKGCRRGSEQPMPYRLDVTLRTSPKGSPLPLGHSIERQFCSLACVADWSSRARVIRRCPGSMGTGWKLGYRANGPRAATVAARSTIRR